MSPAPELREDPELLALTFGELEQLLTRDGVRPAHARALWSSLHAASDEPLARRAVFSPPLARWLEARGLARDLAPSEPVLRQDSLDGRTEKYLTRLGDGGEIETVVMGYPGRFTACLSTQLGCAMGCVFCATGQMGFTRHLRPSEIVAQVHLARRLLARRGHRLRNLVLMGMGEPLHNYEGVTRALEIITDPRGVGIAPRHVTVNTVGVVPGIVRWADERLPYHLGVSLHGSTDEERTRLVPPGKRWPLAELLEACRYYCQTTGKRIFFSWTLIDQVNDGAEHARRLTELLRELPAHVNLIRLNTTARYEGREPEEARALAFQRAIQAAGIPCTLRQERGDDVAAGCGQLRTERVLRPLRRPSLARPEPADRPE